MRSRRDLSQMAKTMAVVGVGVLLVVATVAVWAVESRATAPSSYAPRGLTFAGASLLGTGATSKLAGGLWTLYSALGVTAPLPVWLDPLGEAACRTVPGISVWNASRIPLAPDQYASGAAPFWSLIYENSTGYLVDFVSLNTTGNLIGPIAPGSSCGASMNVFLGNVTVGTSVNSTAAANFAWSLIGSSYVAEHPSAFVFYETGAGQLPLWGSVPDGWIVGYQLCGLPGHTGSNATNSSEVAFTSPTGEWITSNVTGGCSNGAYRLTYGPEVNSSGPGGSRVTVSGLALGFSNSSNLTDGWGLLSGATNVTLTNTTSGTQYQPGPLDCNLTDLSLAKCGAPVGWYAAISLPSGYWLDAFGSIDGHPSWLLPNVPFYTGDNLVIVSDATQKTEGVRLALTSAAGDVTITGSTLI
jgi:hypothetical protein